MAEFAQDGIPLLVNRSRVHFLDRLIIENYCRRQAVAAGAPYQTVRGCFFEGRPVFPGSKILRETHVQVAVRDDSDISGLRVVGLEQVDALDIGGTQ